MQLSKMTIVTSLFIFTNTLLFLSLYISNYHVPLFVLNITLAMAFFAVFVMNVLVKVRKRQLELLKQPFRIGSIAFALAGMSGASRSLILGLQTGIWEYWAMMINFAFFIVSVFMLWYNKFIERLLQDIKQK